MNTNTQIKENEIAYTIDGEAVRVRSIEKTGYLAARLFEELSLDGESVSEGEKSPEFFKDLFVIAPRAKLDNELQCKKDLIDSYQSRCDKLLAERLDLQSQILKEKEELEEVKKVLNVHPELRDLMSYIKGEITHLVITGELSKFKIIATTGLKVDERYDRGLRLLSLYGRPNRKMGWVLHEWADGSGSCLDCIPCLSYEAAMEILQQLINEECARLIKKNDTYYWNYERLEKLSAEYDIELPADMKEIISAYKNKEEQDTLKRLQEERDVINNRINSLINKQDILDTI